MSRIVPVALCFVTVFVSAAVPARAQNKTLTALEARIAALEGRVAKLEGTITQADLAGTYRAAALSTDLDGQDPSAGGGATVTMFAYGGVITLQADGTGTIVQGGGASGAIQLAQGTPWTDGSANIAAEAPIDITWSYANGVVTLSDGTGNLDLDLVVGAGGRVLIWAGLGDDGDASIVIGTRLQ